ncbi:hypothetical protein H4R99_001153 [Coemansia sp. RSA 1722]|nr:hypothetical protein IWW45_002994 [Coemansia sp. RSA 485]KAJ2602686.1 hypothetical protein GGF39_000564 [Coemansia sp. RSA 1721]KAJ2605424.1 hypothetical protein H4R99_001153 [Coemansia sp. RSA 1722]KAJ2640262.1 hypothetical protein GGF40_000161 [Coemansia sp. RSA 1286]
MAYSDTHLVKRAGVSTAILLKIKGAVLVKDGKETSCEIALIGEDAGLVSANCFGSEETTDTKYGVLFYNADKDTKPVSYDLDKEDIHIHPGYDSKTLAYNIAVIEFNKNIQSDYKSYIANLSFIPSGTSYTLRSVNNNTGDWNIPNVQEFQTENPECPKWSGVYATNDYVQLCTGYGVSAQISGTECPNPYSAIYSMSDGNVGVLALYSHSVIFGNNTCGGSAKWLNYYTYLFNFEGFAVSVLNRTIFTFNSDGESSTNTSDTNMFIKEKPADIDLSGKVQIGGNIFGRTASTQPSQPSQPSQPEDSPSPTSVSENPENPNNSQGLSSSTKIAIGVVVPSVSLSLIVLSIFLWRWWKRYQQKKSWDPHAENTNINEIAHQLAADTDNDRPPPPYFRVAQKPQDVITETTPSDPEKTDAKQ